MALSTFSLAALKICRRGIVITVIAPRFDIAGNVRVLSSVSVHSKTTVVPELSQIAPKAIRKLEYQKFLSGDKNIIKYDLPSHIHATTTVILDPVAINQAVWVPPSASSLYEQIAPTIEKPEIVEPKKDHSKQEQVCMPWLMRIRHKKMKKHKLKKLRKRMRFVNRRRAQKIRNKKEKLMRQYEANWEKLGREFDPEALVNEQLKQAKAGGWSVDVWTDWKSKAKNSAS